MGNIPVSLLTGRESADDSRVGELCRNIWLLSGIISVLREIVTVEASPQLASLARANIRQISNQVEVVNALFDDALDMILPTLGEGVDLAYIDGHHRSEPTLRYFRRLMPHLNKGALVVFDDVHLSEEMWQAWQVLKARELESPDVVEIR